MMTKRILYVTLINVLFGLTAANAQEAKAEESQEKARSSKFEQFTSRKDALIVRKNYQIGKADGTFIDVRVSEAWELGQSQKTYAAVVTDKTFDFDQLQGMLEAIDRMTKAIPAEFDKVEATSMSLSSVSGLRMVYSTYNDSAGPKRQLYITIPDKYLYGGPSIEPLTKLRELISQARQKLVSLGAK